MYVYYGEREKEKTARNGRKNEEEKQKAKRLRNKKNLCATITALHISIFAFVYCLGGFYVFVFSAD